MTKYFEALTDPRQPGKVMHDFAETIMIVVCAVIAGCDVWEDIADYCRAKEAWFKERLNLKLVNGIPSHDTMSRIFGMLDPKEFQASFIGWAKEACGKHTREIMSLDGKTMCGSRNGDKSLYIWSAPGPARHGQFSGNWL